MVSEKHAGFIINYDKASAHDVLTLIRTIQRTVYERFQVCLETEQRLIGEYTEEELAMPCSVQQTIRPDSTNR